jgi:tetratricopeptide (TPR) repeat protein
MCGVVRSVEVLSPLASYPRAYQDRAIEECVKNGEYRHAAELLQQLCSSCQDEEITQFLLVEKAKVLFADQRHIEAQETFLEAIQKHTAHEPSPHEQQVCASLYSSYEESTQEPEKAIAFEQKVRQLQSQYPSYVSLKLYTAIFCANRGQFIPFFDHFFTAFRQWPDWYLCWKTQGVLHLRLFEASPDETRRLFHRSEAVRCFREAFSRRPSDTSLLVKLLFVLPVEEKRILLQGVVDHLVQLEIPPRRLECFYLIDQALEVHAIEVAEKLIVQAHTWYQYSRALNEFSQRLDAEKKK